MRILYVTAESPILPAGGIGTYIAYAAKAMADAGHEVFLFTWTYGADGTVSSFEPFSEETTRILRVDGGDVWRKYPHGPYNHALSAVLTREIATCVDDWDIDVVEATDYLSPALSYFKHLQSKWRGRDVLRVTYNHGFIEDFYDADQLHAQMMAQDDLVGERQQCRLSDLVIAPSVAALRRLRQFNISENIALVREPYVFGAMRREFSVSPVISYLGRVSLSKGIDKLIYFANVIDEVRPLEGILLIGKCVDTPFKVKSIGDYIKQRLKQRLRDMVVLFGSLKRQVALNMLQSGFISPHLGSAETFSYACIETIDHGLLPIVRRGTPMEEFFPEEFHDCLFDETFSDQDNMRRVFDRVVSRGQQLVFALQEFNKVELAPARIAAEMTRHYDAGLRAKRGAYSILVRAPATVSDVTIAIPAYKPGEEFALTVDSIVAQSAGMPQVLICDDGTPPEDSVWFDYARLQLPEGRIVRQANSGLLGARNTLISRVETPLTVFLDTDDILAPTYLERTLEAYNASDRRPNAVLTQRANFFESSEKVVRDYMADHVHMIRNDFRMTALLETPVLREIGFDSTRRNGEADDWVFWLNFVAAGYRAIMVPELLFHYRVRSGSMSWPWSTGQTSGTSTMVREALTELAQRRPSHAGAIARALHAMTTVSK
jgi:glycosyltransferase involved in cell wall biosynthesis